MRVISSISKICDEKDEKIIGWFQANIGLSSILPSDIINNFRKLSITYQNKLALFAVIDTLKTKSNPYFPCMEIYNIQTTEEKINPIAFTFTEQEER